MRLRIVIVDGEIRFREVPEPHDLAVLMRRFTQRDEHGNPLPCSHEGLVAQLLQRDLENMP